MSSGRRTRYESCVYASTRRLIPGLKMEKIRPDYLLYPLTKRKLELDLYSHKLNLFIDVRGSEHRRFPNRYSRRGWQSYEGFLDLQERDKWKIEQCLSLGMNVIIVNMPLKKERLEIFLRDELKRCNILE